MSWVVSEWDLGVGCVQGAWWEKRGHLHGQSRESEQEVPRK